MVEITEIDGVPVLFARRMGRGTAAGLVFRVGRADETLGSSGLTHLVEHLALHAHGVTNYHYNGSAGVITTQFVMQGSDDDVTGFLGGVAKALCDLPVTRLETEKEILRTEAQGRANGVNAFLPAWRYGAQGFGLSTYPEWGLERVGAADATQWAQSRFCRENAVLWIAGERMPTNLLLDLPSGARHPVPRVTNVVPAYPAYFHGPINGLVFDTLLPRGVATSMFAAVLQRALLRLLRHDSGTSYTVETDYSARGDDMATITLFADATADKHDLLLGMMGDQLKRIKAQGFEPDDVEAVRRMALESFDHADVEAARLPLRAVNLLTGHPDQTLAEVRADIEAVSVQHVNGLAARFLDNALLQVPYGQRAEHVGFATAPTASTASVAGQHYRSRSDDQSTVTIGDAGVTFTRDGEHATVRFDQCAARLDFPDGGRHYVGLDGITVRLEPTTHTVTADVIRAVPDAVPADSIIPMRARASDAIPQPRSASFATSAKRRARIKQLTAWLLLLVAGFLTWWFITEANRWTLEDGEVAERIILFILFAALAAYVPSMILFRGRFQRGQW